MPGEASHQHYVFHSISMRLCCRREPNLHSMNKNDGAGMRPGTAPRNQQRKSGAMGGLTPRSAPEFIAVLKSKKKKMARDMMMSFLTAPLPLPSAFPLP